MSPDELEDSLGKWNDLVIHAIWDKRASDDKKNKGMIKMFLNGKKNYIIKVNLCGILD